MAESATDIRRVPAGGGNGVIGAGRSIRRLGRQRQGRPSRLQLQPLRHRPFRHPGHSAPQQRQPPGSRRVRLRRRWCGQRRYGHHIRR
jgi:hypothetical protein